MVEYSLDDSILKIAVAVLSIAVGILLHLGRGSASSRKKVNTMIELDNPKIVNKYSIQEIEELPQCKERGRASFCRCWKSKTFPFCDGAHSQHNKETGDNLGPLVISTTVQ